MASFSRDYEIFKKFNFERAPVGVSYSLKKPEGLRQLDQKLALCELFVEAQKGEPFYVTRENIQCGEQLLGMTEFPPLMHSGSLGSMFSMFKNAQANSRIYEYIPLLSKDSVKYVSLSPLDKITFEPDVTIFTATVPQAEIIMRASTFTTGKMWNNKGTTCLACCWIYTYPYVSGEINLSISGMGFSMIARQVLPDGLMIISVPADKMGMLIQNLKDMDWHPFWFDLGRDKFIEEVEKRSTELGHQLGAPSNWELNAAAEEKKRRNK